jgi:hypothetical protein
MGLNPNMIGSIEGHGGDGGLLISTMQMFEISPKSSW